MTSTDPTDEPAPLTDAELDARIAELEAADDLGALLILQDEQANWPRRQRVLHAIWRVYAKVPKVTP